MKDKKLIQHFKETLESLEKTKFKTEKNFEEYKKGNDSADKRIIVFTENMVSTLDIMIRSTRESIKRLEAIKQ